MRLNELIALIRATADTDPEVQEWIDGAVPRYYSGRFVPPGVATAPSQYLCYLLWDMGLRDEWRRYNTEVHPELQDEFWWGEVGFLEHQDAADATDHRAHTLREFADWLETDPEVQAEWESRDA